MDYWKKIPIGNGLNLHSLVYFSKYEESMRIIKLSQSDTDFPDRSSVDEYFKFKLANKEPVGKFLLTKGRIAESGILPGESIIFSYRTEITHIAKAASKRTVNENFDNKHYPFYFLIDMETICPAQGTLADVETALFSAGIYKTIVRTQGWPRIPESFEADVIWCNLKIR